VAKIWAIRWWNDCRESCSAGNLLGERVALQVVARGVVLFVKLHSANALEESLLKEYLLIELLSERVARQATKMSNRRLRNL
jgi:hypothetical protein